MSLNKNQILLIFFLLWVTFYPQRKTTATTNPYTNVDNVIDKNENILNSLKSISTFIDSSFTTEEDKCRAIFYWITKHISYAPELMFTYKTTNKRTQLVKDIFENKSGVCIGYATLFDTLCKLTHLRSFIIEGSTKQSFLPSVIGHAWNGVKINNEWKLIDATWGSGYLEHDKFVRKLNNNYYLPDPQKLIKSHLPIDPMWQMLKYPITLHQFYTSTEPIIKTEWQYPDSIDKFLNLAEIEKVSVVALRLDEFGTSSEITSNYYNYLRSKENEYYFKKLNEAGSYYNLATEEYNMYINFKNKQFTPQKPDSAIAQMMPTVKEWLNRSNQSIALLPKEFTETNASYIQNLKKQLVEMNEKAETESKFVGKYLATKKNKRRDLFYTKVYTIYGIPVK